MADNRPSKETLKGRTQQNQEPQKSFMGQLYVLSLQLAFEFVGIIGIGGLLGYKLDCFLHCFPRCLILFLSIFTIISIVRAFWFIKRWLV